METIIETLESEIPTGYWCHDSNGWCKYHERKKPTLSDNGMIRINYCNLLDVYVNRKRCEINV